jgi:hypothetical protein
MAFDSTCSRFTCLLFHLRSFANEEKPQLVGLTPKNMVLNSHKILITKQHASTVDHKQLGINHSSEDRPLHQMYTSRNQKQFMGISYLTIRLSIADFA